MKCCLFILLDYQFFCLFYWAQRLTHVCTWMRTFLSASTKCINNSNGGLLRIRKKETQVGGPWRRLISFESVSQSTLSSDFQLVNNLFIQPWHFSLNSLVKWKENLFFKWKANKACQIFGLFDLLRWMRQLNETAILDQSRTVKSVDK